MTFDGASVLVTGGSRGIGKAIALRFASLGATRIAIGYMRGDAAAEETAADLRELGAEPILVRGNVASTRVAEQVAELGPLDVLIHAAATGVIRPALETEDKHWDWTLSANARALLSLTRAAAPAMPSGSSIVGISSLGSERVLDGYTLVGASKAALEALVRYLAVELAPRGIRVNAVSAGVVETGALEHFPNKEAMLEMGVSNPVGQARVAGGCGQARHVPVLTRCRDDPRADGRRRRRLVAPDERSDGVGGRASSALARHPSPLRAHEALTGCRDERHRLGEQHAHRITQSERLRVGRAFDLHLAKRRRSELDRSRERQGRELLALRLLHGIRLLLGELAERAEEILGIAPAEREETAAAFHRREIT